MNKTTAILILAFIVLITIPIFFITIPVIIFLYNSIVKKENQVDYAYGAIDVMLKKRSDLIPNIVGSVNKIMSHEKDLLERITKLRSGIKENENNQEKRFSLENQMSQLLGELKVTVENYPEIKSNENMLHLQRTLNETEEQISASRRMYNAAVINYNNSIETIPTNIIAASMERKKKTYFKASEEDKKNPSTQSLFES